MISNEAQLLIQLLLLHPSEDEKREIDSLLSSPLRWERLDHLARINGHRTWALEQLETLGWAERLPPAIHALWSEDRDRIRARLVRRFAHARNLFVQFQREGIPVALLKGTALSRQIYQNPYYKKSNDIDVLVPLEAMPQVYALYDRLGYLPFGERIKKDTGVQAKVAWNAPPFVSPDLALVMGTQWGIKTFRGPYRVDYEQLWSRVVEVDFEGVRMKALSPEDTLLHLCLHLGYFKTQLKDLIDITNLLRFYRGRLRCDEFVETAIRARAASHAYHALYLSNRLDPSAEVSRMLEKLRPLAWPHYRRGAEKKSRSIDTFLELSVDWIQRIEIEMTLFLGARGFRAKSRAFGRVWETILAPPREAMLRMNFTLAAGPLASIYYRLVTPYRILRALAEEIGWSVVILLSLKTWMDLALSPFERGEPTLTPYAALARDLGKSEAEIEAFTKEFT